MEAAASDARSARVLKKARTTPEASSSDREQGVDVNDASSRASSCARPAAEEEAQLQVTPGHGQGATQHPEELPAPSPARAASSSNGAPGSEPPSGALIDQVQHPARGLVSADAEAQLQLRAAEEKIKALSEALALAQRKERERGDRERLLEQQLHSEQARQRQKAIDDMWLQIPTNDLDSQPAADPVDHGRSYSQETEVIDLDQLQQPNTNATDPRPQAPCWFPRVVMAPLQPKVLPIPGAKVRSGWGPFTPSQTSEEEFESDHETETESEEEEPPGAICKRTGPHKLIED